MGYGPGRGEPRIVRVLKKPVNALNSGMLSTIRNDPMEATIRNVPLVRV
jgi:hypothetical protein